MQKIWTFVKNGNSPPATLMDVPEGVVCVVNVTPHQEVMLRTRSGSRAFSATKDGSRLYEQGAASSYKFLAYYGTPPVEPLPTCLSEAKPYQLYKLSNYKWLYWKDESRCVWSLDSTGRIMQETEGVTSTVLAVRIDSLSDLTAIPTEV